MDNSLLSEGMAMLDGADLKTLARWCDRRRMRWSPATTDSGDEAILIEGSRSLAPWQEMLLVADDPEFRLFDGPGRELASASDLQALLDAVDAGVAAPSLFAPNWSAAPL